MLINHTHPKGTPYASDKDMRLMSYLKQLGSPQKTSTIYPVGKKPVKYDRKRRIKWIFQSISIYEEKRNQTGL